MRASASAPGKVIDVVCGRRWARAPLMRASGTRAVISRSRRSRRAARRGATWREGGRRRSWRLRRRRRWPGCWRCPGGGRVRGRRRTGSGRRGPGGGRLGRRGRRRPWGRSTCGRSAKRSRGRGIRHRRGSSRGPARRRNGPGRRVPARARPPRRPVGSCRSRCSRSGAEEERRFVSGGASRAARESRVHAAVPPTGAVSNSKPSAARYRAGARTDGCSMGRVTMRRRASPRSRAARAAPRSARLLLSVAPPVKTISSEARRPLPPVVRGRFRRSRRRASGAVGARRVRVGLLGDSLHQREGRRVHRRGRWWSR